MKFSLFCLELLFKQFVYLSALSQLVVGGGQAGDRKWMVFTNAYYNG